MGHSCRTRQALIVTSLPLTPFPPPQQPPSSPHYCTPHFCLLLSHTDHNQTLVLVRIMIHVVQYWGYYWLLFRLHVSTTKPGHLSTTQVSASWAFFFSCKELCPLGQRLSDCRNCLKLCGPLCGCVCARAALRLGEPVKKKSTGFQARSKDQEILEEGGGAGPSTLPRRDHE